MYNFPLHCIVSYEVCIYQNFTTKVACICIPKNYVNCIDFLHLMSKSCGFGMTGPLDESISCFLIRVDPWVLVPITFRGLHVLANRGLHALTFRGLHVLALRGLHALTLGTSYLHLQRTTRPRLQRVMYLQLQRTTRPRRQRVMCLHLCRATRPHLQRTTRPHL